jgi:DNA polymerase-3 subunit gamma/tau
VLEIRVDADAPKDLASRLTKHLSESTGQRWMVSLSSAEGAPTLAEQDKAAEKKRTDQALAHPLMQAVVKTFPGAKMTALRQKVAPLPATVADEADEPIPFPEIEE